MITSITFQICSLIYLLLLIILYFSKERYNSLENRIYKMTMIVNLFAIIFDIISVFTIYYMKDSILNIVVSKIYLICILAWLITLIIYIFTISLVNTEENTHKIKKICFVNLIIFCIGTIIVVFLPIKFVNEPGIIYSYGSSTKFIYLFSAFCIFIWMIRIALRFKYIKKKKCIPIIFYVILGSISSIIQNSYPQFLLASFFETFVTFLMYFTIENPDMKLIKELNIAKDEADKANQAKSDFLSSMSHEIRTPLNAIVGFSQILSEEDLPQSALDEVNDIVMASNGLLEIVNGILDISKIESGKIEIVNSEYNFKKIFLNLVALTKARMGDKNLDFRFHYDESIPAVIYGDHTRVKQIILNILTNAIKYTREGYVDFRVSSIVKGEVCRLIIAVEDSGIGIKKENVNKLFSKFERLDLDKNITIEGTGLGLAITKKLIELMNGKIVVQSVYGKGSRFTIAIDQRIIKMKVQKEEVVVAEEKVSKNIDATGKKVLIVDDNKINLKVASRLLQSYKVVTEEIESGFICLDKINNGETYDLILMDDMMPKMSGIETLKKLKEIPNFNMKVIALTANAIEGMREKYIAEGFDDYLAKPINRDELNKLVARYLNK